MTKKVVEMSDAELIQSYKKGKGWLVRNEQVAKTGKNAEGKEYDPAMYFMGLSRLEDIEGEMVKRGIVL